MKRMAVRVLIAHSGSSLASEDVGEILKHAWDGEFAADAKVTAQPLAATAWAWEGQPDEQFAYAWFAWQAVLKYKAGEHPYWEDLKTQTYAGTVTRTGQRFYSEIYYKD